jgi:hypothetical protein
MQYLRQQPSLRSRFGRMMVAVDFRFGILAKSLSRRFQKRRQRRRPNQGTRMVHSLFLQHVFASCRRRCQAAKPADEANAAPRIIHLGV